MTETRQLLAEYVGSASDGAFRELVARYLGLVYATAVRLLDGDTHAAEDVAQTVFIHLAQKARHLPADVMLGGWLHRDTCHVAANLLRGERRRRIRERQALEMSSPDHDETNLAQLAASLDEAINQLAAPDRAVILLRFFEQQDFRTIGQVVGTSEDTAQKRVTRALERLQILLQRGGVSSTAAALGTALTASLASAVPPGLTISIAEKALSATAAAGWSTSVFNMATMTKLQTASLLGAVTLMTALTAGFYFQRQKLLRLEFENRQLQAEVALVRSRQTETGPGTPGASEDEIAALRRDQRELQLLRGEVGQLRRSMAASTPHKAAPSESEPMVFVADLPRFQQGNLPQPVQLSVSLGSSVAVGGWTNESGQRVLALTTPQLDDQSPGEITLKTSILDAPEELLTQIPSEKTNSADSGEMWHRVLSSTDMNALLRKLDRVSGARLRSTTSLTTVSGTGALFDLPVDIPAFVQDRPGNYTIQLIPKLADDKKATELTILPPMPPISVTPVKEPR